MLAKDNMKLWELSTGIVWIETSSNINRIYLVNNYLVSESPAGLLFSYYRRVWLVHLSRMTYGLNKIIGSFALHSGSSKVTFQG